MAYIDNIFVNPPTNTKRKRFCISNEAFYYLWLGLYGMAVIIFRRLNPDGDLAIPLMQLII